MGVVTGKGLSDLIREEFGLRLTFVADGAAGGGELHQRGDRVHRVIAGRCTFPCNKFISVPFCAALGLVHGGERAATRDGEDLLVASVVYIAYIFAGVLSQPSCTTRCWPP